MRYYPKLKLFKNSNATNTFDGYEAKSYSWYVYAYVINNVIFEVEKPYSPTTTKHISEFHSLTGYDTTRFQILAPQGLNNLDEAVKAINSEIVRLELELTNKRNRNKQQRIDRIEKLKLQLTYIDQLKAAINSNKNKAA